MQAGPTSVEHRSAGAPRLAATPRVGAAAGRWTGQRWRPRCRPDELMVDGELRSGRPRRPRPGARDPRRGRGRAPGRAGLVLGPEHRRESDGVVVREVVVDGWRVEVELEPERRASLRERARRASDVAGRGGPVEVRRDHPGSDRRPVGRTRRRRDRRPAAPRPRGDEDAERAPRAARGYDRADPDRGRRECRGR